LTTAISPIGLFGAADKIIDGETEAWCIAKIIRLVGHIEHPHKDSSYHAEFKRAEELAVIDHPLGPAMKLITRVHWRKELEDIPDPPVPSDLLDFIQSLLVIDLERRPSAREALLHPYLQSGGL
jgi:serine/threonine protein kinase